MTISYKYSLHEKILQIFWDLEHTQRHLCKSTATQMKSEMEKVALEIAQLFR